jgi:uncharacterized membrane protein (UPF0127 family)
MRAVSVSLKGGGLVAGLALATEDVSERIEGWMRKDSVAEGEGILIAPCASIHTLGMRVTIDVVFLDEALRVTKVASRVKPNRFAFGSLKNLLRSWRSQALELPAGAAAGLKPGDVLEVVGRPA